MSRAMQCACLLPIIYIKLLINDYATRIHEIDVDILFNIGWS